MRDDPAVSESGDENEIEIFIDNQQDATLDQQ